MRCDAESQVERVENDWNRLSLTTKYWLIFRAIVMTSKKFVTAVVAGTIGATITAGMIAVTAGVAHIQDLWWLVLGVFVGLFVGVIIGIKSST